MKKSKIPFSVSRQSFRSAIKIGDNRSIVLNYGV